MLVVMVINTFIEYLYSLNIESYECYSEVISLLINNYFGGYIMYSDNYYNVIDGKYINIFNSNINSGYVVSVEDLLKNEKIFNLYNLMLYKIKEFHYYKLIDFDGHEYKSLFPGKLGGNKKLKIYGHLDCPSANRWISRGYYVSNRVFFENEDIAISCGYRPCAVCMPDEYRKWKQNQLKLKK